MKKLCRDRVDDRCSGASRRSLAYDVVAPVTVTRVLRKSRQGIALGLWLAAALAGCDSSSGVPEGVPPPRIPAPPVPESQVRGHFHGGAAIGDATYYVDALITVDRDVRVHVAGPFDEGTVLFGGGLPEAADPAESVLFVGDLETIGDENLGQGVVLGQACARSNPGRFCDVPAPASISIKWRPPLPDERFPTMIAGEIRVTTSAAEESWRLDLSLSWRSGGNHFFGFDLYRQSAYGGPSGQFLESLAGFAQADDTIVTLDVAGRLFFQSPASGCVGNGTLARRPPYYAFDDYAFDVHLLIANCNASYKSLNGVFEGLATIARDNLEPCREWLLIFLSAPEGSAPRSAFTMRGSDPSYCGCGWCY